MNALFYIAALVAVVATVLTLTRLNPVHALLYLIVSLLAVAVTFFTLGAPLVAAFEVIIYAGAIMVLFVFVVMLLNLGERAVEQERVWVRPGMFVGPGVLAAVLVGEVAVLLARGRTLALPAGRVDPRAVGVSLFGPYLLGVELASFLLLGALVGAYHLGERRSARRTHDVDTHRARVASGSDLVRTGPGGASGAP
jgi:NADH-quinone oxidoreductase subunit J